MLSAKEARKLAGVKDEDIVKEELERLDSIIKNAAKKGKRSVSINCGLIADEAYEQSSNYKTVCDELARLGYDVMATMYGNQFLGMSVVISW